MLDFHVRFLDIKARQMNVELIYPIIFSLSKGSIQIWQCLNIQLD